MAGRSIVRSAYIGAGRHKLQATLTTLLLLLLVGCTTPADQNTLADEVIPVEEQQIVNVVEDYYVRQSAVVPEYEAEVEEVENNWARVSIRPVGVEVSNGPEIFYLQNQVEAERELPTPTVELTPPQSARRSTDTGWVIVAGPQARFTPEELNAAGVPAFIRP